MWLLINLLANNEVACDYIQAGIFLTPSWHKAIVCSAPQETDTTWILGKREQKHIETHTCRCTTLTSQMAHLSMLMVSTLSGMAFPSSSISPWPSLTIARSCLLQLYDRLKHQQPMFCLFLMPLAITIHHFIQLHQNYKSLICEWV